MSTLFYAYGEDFDARQEIWDLQARVSVEDRHVGYLSAVRLLLDIAIDGFRPDGVGRLLSVTEIDNILLFEDSGVRLAFEVPGNGRYETPDIMLLTAKSCPRRKEDGHASTRTALVQDAARRQSKGQRGQWPFAGRR
jgi:hypothetical protein